MTIAYTMAHGHGGTDLLLARVAQHLQRRGVKTCGTIQINTDNAKSGRCDMDVRVLPRGPVIRISQSLGKQARGCRLDSAALEAAVGYVKTELDKGAQLLIINKFGKQEAEGGGFRDVIANAVSNDIPVLVGLNALNKSAFEEFSGGLAKRVQATKEELVEWAKSALDMQLATA